MEDLENKYDLTWRYIMAWSRESPGIQTQSMIEGMVVK